MRMERISLTIPSPQNKALRALAKATDLPINDHIRRALTDYLKANQPGEQHGKD